MRELYDQPLKLPSGWPGCAFVFCWGIGFGSALLMAPLGIGIIFGLIGWGAATACLAAAWRWLGPRRRGILLDDAGLHEQYWLRPTRHIPWSAVQRIRSGVDGPVIQALDGDVVGDPAMTTWPRLVRRVQQVITGASDADEEPGEDLDPREIADWLGIEPDGVLICQGRRNPIVGLLLLPVWLAVTFGLVAFYSMFLRGDGPSGAGRLGMILFLLAHGSIFIGVFSGGLGYAVWRNLVGTLLRIEADVSGVRVADRRGRRHIAWDELRACRMVDGRWTVTTDDDEFAFEGTLTNASRLLRAIQEGLRAREAGWRLPAGGPVPAGAISLARETGRPEAVERGLSLSDEP